MEISGNSATKIVKESILRCTEEGRKVTRWGGTIPSKVGATDFNRDRKMIEIPYFAAELTDPRKWWTPIGNSTFITLREAEDHMQGWNPGKVVEYSKMYRGWVQDGKLPLNYGQRLRSYPGGRYVDIMDRNVHVDQLAEMAKKLIENPSTRKAGASMWDPEIDHYSEFPPCNVFFHATIDDGKLNWTTLNRALDLHNGLSEDFGLFVMWHYELANRIGIEVGTHRMISSNAHVYEDNLTKYADIETIVDPYEVSSTKVNYPMVPFERVARFMESVDISLSKNWPFRDTLNYIADIDMFWYYWKCTGVFDFYMNQKNYDRAREAIDDIVDLPWYNVCSRRLQRARGVEVNGNV